MTARLTRRDFALTALAAVLVRPPAPAWSAAGPAAPGPIVEDWRDTPLGSRGVPAGWRKYETPGGHPAYDFTVVEDGARRALDLRSAADHSTIAKEVQVALAATPLLEWEWKALTLPPGADLRERATSDTTGHLFVIWPRFPALLRSRLIGYVWDASLPVGSIIKSSKTSTVTFIVARRGTDGLGQWHVERRNVIDDHRRIFGEAPDNPQALALSIDTNDTRSTAEARFARIAFAGA